jgi:hypothetical protein
VEPLCEQSMASSPIVITPTSVIAEYRARSFSECGSCACRYVRLTGPLIISCAVEGFATGSGGVALNVGRTKSALDRSHRVPARWPAGWPAVHCGRE